MAWFFKRKSHKYDLPAEMENLAQDEKEDTGQVKMSGIMEAMWVAGQGDDWNYEDEDKEEDDDEDDEDEVDYIDEQEELEEARQEEEEIVVEEDEVDSSGASTQDEHKILHDFQDVPIMDTCTSTMMSTSHRLETPEERTEPILLSSTSGTRDEVRGSVAQHYMDETQDRHDRRESDGYQSSTLGAQTVSRSQTMQQSSSDSLEAYYARNYIRRESRNNQSSGHYATSSYAGAEERSSLDEAYTARNYIQRNQQRPGYYATSSYAGAGEAYGDQMNIKDRMVQDLQYKIDAHKERIAALEGRPRKFKQYSNSSLYDNSSFEKAETVHLNKSRETDMTSSNLDALELRRLKQSLERLNNELLNTLLVDNQHEQQLAMSSCPEPELRTRCYQEAGQPTEPILRSSTGDTRDEVRGSVAQHYRDESKDRFFRHDGGERDGYPSFSMGAQSVGRSQTMQQPSLDIPDSYNGRNYIQREIEKPPRPGHHETSSYAGAQEEDVLDQAADFGKLLRECKPQLEKIQSLEMKLKKQEGKVVKVEAGPLHSLPPAAGQDEPDGPVLKPMINGLARKIRRNEKLQKTKAAFERLTKKIQPRKEKLDNITQQVQKDPRVEQARELWRYKKETFISDLFEGIQKGDLRDVQAKFVALDLNGEDEQELHSLKNCYGYHPLHVALLFNHDHIAHFLVDHSGERLTTQSICRESEYKELTPLHLALYQSDASIIEKIINSVPKAWKAQYVNKRILVETYKGQPYGELPLAATTWSCMQNQKLEDVKKILGYLVHNGADMDMKTEKDQNTLLHLIVLQALESMSMLDYFKQFLSEAFWPAAEHWWRKHIKRPENINRQTEQNPKVAAIRHLMSLKNKDGLTPLALAARVESPVYLMLVQWEQVMRIPDPKSQNFAPKFYYDITDIVSIDEQGAYNSKSVMHVLAHNHLDLCGRNWKTDIVETEPMKTVIKKKWKYYSWFFYGWGLFHMIYMILLTYFTLTHPSIISPTINASNVLRPTESSYQVEVNNLSGNPYFALFLTVPILYFIFELFDLVGVTLRDKHQMHSRPTITGNFCYRAISVIFIIFIVIWFCLHMMENINQDILLALSLLFGWIFCIFFTRTIDFPSKESQIGAFSIMVQRMLFHDLIPFLSISFFLIISFTAAIQASLMFSKPAEDSNFFFMHTLYQMIKYFAAMDDPMGEGTSRDQHFAKILLVIYGIIISVLLINMLIAAMNKSYDIIRQTHCNLVLRQRLAILLMLERRLICFRKASEKGLYDQIRDRRFVTVIQKTVLHDMMKSSPK